MAEPEVIEEVGEFSGYFFKDIYTEENLRKMALNERQIKAVKYVKEKGKITNKEYKELTDASKPTATIDLRALVEKKIFKKIGVTGRGTEYVLIKQRDNNGLKGLTKG